ncbi:hypothetical protein OMR07_00200 [Methylobacterium organophilum]|nr:hypothetical protein [Methylobacterium organophilum]
MSQVQALRARVRHLTEDAAFTSIGYATAGCLSAALGDDLPHVLGRRHGATSSGRRWRSRIAMRSTRQLGGSSAAALQSGLPPDADAIDRCPGPEIEADDGAPGRLVRASPE